MTKTHQAAQTETPAPTCSTCLKLVARDTKDGRALFRCRWTNRARNSHMHACSLYVPRLPFYKKREPVTHKRKETR